MNNKQSIDMRIILTLYLLILTTFNASSNTSASMPIIAYMGPPVKSVSVAEYNEMQMCGFTHTLNIYNTIEDAKADLERAAKTKIKVFVHTPQLTNEPRLSAMNLKQHSALAGYFLADEPNVEGLTTFGLKARQIRTVDPTRPCYVNLHPYYDDNQMRNIGVKSYRQYLQDASKMGLPQISFDFYPVTKNGLRNTWFFTLEEIRKESLRTSTPFWGYVLTVPHTIYPAPTLEALRLQAYVNLAYGAQAIEYFTYRTPIDDRYDFKDAIIGLDGKRTAIYNLVKAFNRELKNVSQIFNKAKINHVGHLIKIPPYCAKAKVPACIKSLIVKGKKGAVVSIITKNKHAYMAVVNKDHTEGMSLQIKAASDKVVHVTKTLNTEKLKNSYQINPGDIALFKLK